MTLWPNHEDQSLDPVGDLGGTRVIKSTRDKDGSCNFCRRDPQTYDIVYVLQGDHLQVRMCKDCIEVVKGCDLR